MAHETVIRSSLLVRDVQNPNIAAQKFAVFTGSGNNDLNLLGFRTPTELLSDIGFNEAVDDRVSTLIQAGANISVTYDDDGNALIIAAPNTVTGSGTATQIAFWKSGSTTELTSSSNLYWDNVNGRLGLGTTTPSGKLNTISTSDVNALHQRISNDITSPGIIFRKARGTIASPTVVQQGDLLGSFGFSGLLSDGTTYSNDNSFFGGQVSGPVTSTNLPTSIFFKVGQTATPYLVSFYIHDSGRSRFSSEAISSALPQPRAKLEVIGQTNANTGWTAQFHNNLGNSNSLVIRDDGNVGIGTSGTTARFIVRASGSSSGSTAMLVENSGGTAMLTVREDSNVGIGTSSPNSRLQINAFGTGSTTSALLIQNSATTTIFSIRENGDLYGRSGIFYLGSDGRIYTNRLETNTATTGSIEIVGGYTGTRSIAFGTFTSVTKTSGNYNVTEFSSSGFNPTSGNGTFNIMSVGVTINQTGGASGTTRGVYIQPTLTSAFDWRSIEWNNDSGFGLYGAGSGTNYLNGNLGIKTTTPAQTLHVAGTMRLTGNAGTATEVLGRDASGDLSGVSFSTIVASGGGVSGSGTATQIAFWKSGSTKELTSSSNLYWDDVNGRLGVGINTPSARYHQSQTQGIFARYDITNPNADQNRGVWEFYTNTAVTPDFFGRFGFKFEGGVNNAAKHFQLHVNDATNPRLIVNGNGNVGISTITPNARLQVHGTDTSDSNWTAQFHNVNGNNNSLMIRNDGRVGFGTNSPSKPFHVTGESYFVGALQLEGGLKDNRDNVFLSQSLNSVTANRDLVIGNAIYARIRLHAKGVSVGASFPASESLFYVDGGTASSILDRQGIYLRPTQPQAGGNTNGGDVIIELPNGTGTGRKGTVLIGASATTINSALLELVSTDRGFLPPRMTTTQRDAIATPATGLQIYNTTLNVMQHYNGTTWVSEAGGGGGSGTVTGSGTATQVAFWKSGSTTELTSNSNLYWDDVNSRLGVGITTPTSNLDVVGSVEFQNPTTAYDGGVLGSELLTTGTGTNWTGTSFATGYLHATGSTVALVAATSPANATHYQIEITTSGRTAGSFTFSFGGYTSSAVSADGTTTIGPLTTSTSPLTITPTSTFDGTVSATIKSIGSSSAVFKILNSSGTTVYEQRAGNNDTNMFLGRLAGLRNTTGITNTFIGNQAGQNNTTASFNTFIGNGAGIANTTGESNLFIGAGAGSSNRSGFNNFFMGRSAGLSNTVGNGNLAIGTSTGVLMVSGNSNVYLGGGSGYNNASGSNNVLIGALAGRFYSESSLADTSINNSIFIGTDTRSTLSGQTNQIIIANNGRGLGSNTTVIGNTGTTQTHLHGSLTLGSTTSPAARMVVTGPQPSGTTTWTAQFHNALGDSNSLMIRDDGNVGVGTNNPDFRVTVRTNDAGLFVRAANVAPFNQIIASFVYGGNGNTINVEPSNGKASLQARISTTVGAAAHPLYINPFGGSVSINNSNPDASAIFDVKSTTQGFLPPRMTTADRNLISSPATGLQVYNSTLNVMQHYNGVSWVNEANPILTRVSTGTTQVELFLDGVSSRFNLVGANKVWNFRIQLCAIVASAGTGTLDPSDSYISEHLIGIKRFGSSINVVGGGVVQNLIGANPAMEDSVVTITGDSGTESIRVFYTPPSGAAANTVIRISATLYYTEAGV